MKKRKGKENLQSNGSKSLRPFNSRLRFCAMEEQEERDHISARSSRDRKAQHSATSRKVSPLPVRTANAH